MPRNCANWSLALLALVPELALAHGEEVLLFPVGTLASVATIVLIAFACRIRWQVRILAGIMAIAASIPFWLAPGSFYPSIFRHTGWGNFVIGYLPPLIVGSFVLWLLRRQQ